MVQITIDIKNCYKCPYHEWVEWRRYPDSYNGRDIYSCNVPGMEQRTSDSVYELFENCPYKEEK